MKPMIRRCFLALVLTVILLFGSSMAHAQLPVTGTMDQGVRSSSPGAWPVTPAQAIETMNLTQTSVSGAAQTLTLLGSPLKRVAIRGIVCYLSAAGTSTITVSDGGTVVLDLGTFTNLAAGAFSFGIASGVWGGLSNSMTVNIGAASGVTSTCSVIADRS